MMKNAVRAIAFMLMLTLFCPAALAAAATPTPPPVEIPSTVVEPPAAIQNMLNIAYNEFETLAGEQLSDANKYTLWQGEEGSADWSADFVTWVMMEAGIPMMALQDIQDTAQKAVDGLFRPEGLYHCRETSPGKLLRAYQLMERTAIVPQKGFLALYGCSYNKVIHVGIVCDVVDLGGGKYRITTLEGGINGTVKMFIRDYDMNAAINTTDKQSTNLSVVPEEERTVPGSDAGLYEVMSGQPSTSTKGKYMYYINRFLMPWVPGDPALSAPIPEATAEPAPTETPAPTAEPTSVPTAEPAAEPTATPAADSATKLPVIANVVAMTPSPAATQAPEATLAPTPAPTAEPSGKPTAEPTAKPAAEPTPEPAEDSAYPCQGKDGACTYITYSADDPFCRTCDRNDNGVEDSKEKLNTATPLHE